MKIMVSYITDRFSTLQDFWKRAQEKKEGSAFQGTDTSEELDLGGLIQIIDWDTKKVIQNSSLQTPAGFDINESGIYVATRGTKIALLDGSLHIQQELSHPMFNDLHAINLTPQGILVSSTGLDSIIEITFDGREVFSWMANEHGYNMDPKGRIRDIEQNKDHRNSKYPTLQQTTHLNSAIDVGKTVFYENTIYASLFHQGKIVAINKTTGENEIVLGGLNHPHALYQYGSMILFSDTENQRVFITDTNFEKPRPLDFPQTNWIQDASLLSNGNLLLCDSNNHRLLEVEQKTKRIVDQLEFSREYKVYQARELL